MFSSSSAFSRDPFVAFAPMTHTEAQSETVGDSVGTKAEGAGPVLTRPRSLSSLSATVSTVSVSSPPSTSSHSRQISGSLGLGAQPSPAAAPSGVQTESRSRLRVCSPTVCPVAPHIVSAVSCEGYGGVSVSSAERRAGEAGRLGLETGDTPARRQPRRQRRTRTAPASVSLRGGYVAASLGDSLRPSSPTDSVSLVSPASFASCSPSRSSSLSRLERLPSAVLRCLSCDFLPLFDAARLARCSHTLLLAAQSQNWIRRHLKAGAIHSSSLYRSRCSSSAVSSSSFSLTSSSSSASSSPSSSRPPSSFCSFAAPHCASASAEDGHEGPLLSGVAGACAGREDAQSLSSSPSCTCKSCACCGEGLLYGGDKETRRLRRRVWLLALGRLDRLGLQIARELQWESASLAAGSLACDGSRKAQAQQVRAATQDAKRRQRLGKTQTADEEGGGEEEEQHEENEREDDDEQEEIQIAGGVATEGEEARRREGRARGELEGGASCCEHDGDPELPGHRLHCGRGTKETRERKRLASSGGRDAGRLPSSQAAREAIAALYPRAFMPNVCFDLSGPLSIARAHELQQLSSERRRPFRFSSFGAEASPCGAGEEKRTTAPLPGEEEEDEPLLPWPCREIFAFLLECRLDEARADEIRRDVPRTFPRHP
ncbi:TBC domain-containing protein [Toxoplasma gondii MAS]|uniref:TBC domain-containing protein n=1 Tax=Toxoplasma gondii MAS TaxID=943118 RepID=A0A086QD58_TOXGO|nr:TBC domain-containing protein [Toxoplasma gondii MAS]